MTSLDLAPHEQAAADADIAASQAVGGLVIKAERAGDSANSNELPTLEAVEKQVSEARPATIEEDKTAMTTEIAQDIAALPTEVAEVTDQVETPAA